MESTIPKMVEAEVAKQINNALEKELTPEAQQLVIKCPYIINRLAAQLENAFKSIGNDNPVLEPIVIQQWNYPPKMMDYDN